jgi:predicted dehydrogenase
MKEVRIGMIGVGGYGLFCLQQYRQLPNVRITAIAGTRPEKYQRLAAEYDIPFHTVHWEDLIARDDVDIVYLGTTPDLHAAQTIAAATAGKHVFCEKPLALSMAESEAMQYAADAAGVRLGIDFVMRYNPLYAILRSICDQQILGPLQRFVFHNDATDLPSGHWFWQPEVSGSIPVEHGGHFFDIFTSMLGEGTVRWATAAQRSSGERDKWLAVLQYDGYTLGSFYHAFSKPGLIEQTWVEVDFARGYVRLDGWIPTRLEISGLLRPGDVAPLSSMIPAEAISAFPESQRLLGDGKELLATHEVHGLIDLGEKQAVYAQAVREAMADFIAWTLEPSHHPRVTGMDGARALATGLEVIRLAENTG